MISTLQTGIRSCSDKKSFVFYAAFCFWIAVRILEQSMLSVSYDTDTVFKAIEFFSLLLMLLVSLPHVFNSRLKWLTLLLVAAVTLLVVYASGRLYVLQIVLIVFLAHYYSLRILLKCGLYTIILTCSGIVLASLIDVIPNYLFTWGERERFGLGFKYVTYLPAFMLTIVLLYFYIYHAQIKTLTVLALLFLEGLLYVLTNSRFLCVLGFASIIVLTFACKRSPKKAGVGVRLLGLTPALFIVFPFIALLIAWFYDPTIAMYSQLNKVLSNRLYLSQMGLETWGIQPFGCNAVSNAVEWENGIARLPSTVNVIDSSYLSSFIFYGWFFTGLLLLAFVYCSRKAYLHGDYVLTTCFFLLAIMGLFEPRLFLLEYDPFLIVLGFTLKRHVDYSSKKNNRGTFLKLEKALVKKGQR